MKINIKTIIAKYNIDKFRLIHHCIYKCIYDSDVKNINKENSDIYILFIEKNGRIIKISYNNNISMDELELMILHFLENKTYYCIGNLQTLQNSNSINAPEILDIYLHDYKNKSVDLKEVEHNILFSKYKFTSIMHSITIVSNEFSYSDIRYLETKEGFIVDEKKHYIHVHRLLPLENKVELQEIYRDENKYVKIYDEIEDVTDTINDIVIFNPLVVKNLFMLLVRSLSSALIKEGNSFVSPNKIGEVLINIPITVMDKPNYEIQHYYDYEGNKLEDKKIIENGKLICALNDLYDIIDLNYSQCTSGNVVYNYSNDQAIICETQIEIDINIDEIDENQMKKYIRIDGFVNERIMYDQKTGIINCVIFNNEERKKYYKLNTDIISLLNCILAVSNEKYVVGNYVVPICMFDLSNITEIL